MSFLDGADYAKALKEMNGKYIGSRPCKLRKSTWDDRQDVSKKAKSGKPVPKRKNFDKRKHIGTLLQMKRGPEP